MRIVLALALGSFVSASCAPAIGNVARRGTEEATQGVLEQASQPESTAQMADILGDPRIADATVQLVDRVTTGLLDSLSSDHSQERLSVLLVALTDALVRAFARGIERYLGPALANVLRRDVADGLAHATDGVDVNGALGNTARVVAREAVIGANEGLGTATRQPHSAVRQVEHTATKGIDLFRVGAIALGLLVLALAILLARSLVRMRRTRAEADRREAAMLLLATAIKGAEDRPWAGEMLELVRSTLRDAEGADVVREILRKDPNLRLRRDSTPPPDTSGFPPTMPHPT